MPIQKLPEEAIGKLQSGVVITDVVQCALELVYNSLDAGATTIVIRIDLNNCQIQVIDNGRGIPSSDLENLGVRFMTSKYQNYVNLREFFTTYGYKGQAIACLVDVCKRVTVKTKTDTEEETYIKVFNGSEPGSIEKNYSRTEAGTCVTLDDFLHSFPVRRNRINESVDFEELKTHLKNLAIIHFNVSFTLKNDSKGSIVFESQAASSILNSVKNLYGSRVAKRLKSVTYQDDQFSVAGLISQKPRMSCNMQLISVNKHVVTRGAIHKAVNKLMTYYIRELSQSVSSLEDVLFTVPANNAFVLEIGCPRSDYELFSTLRRCSVKFKNWKKLVKCLKKTIKCVFFVCGNVTSPSLDSWRDGKGLGGCNDNGKQQQRRLPLVNALKGVPARRPNDNLICKSKAVGNVRHEKQTGDRIESKKNVTTLTPKYDLSAICSSVADCTVDSLESPIPRKWTKLDIVNCHQLSIQSGVKDTFKPNQSIFQFYNWIKKKVESDSDAFKFYQSFLRFKQNESVGESDIVSRRLFDRHTNRPGNMYMQSGVGDNTCQSIVKNWLEVPRRGVRTPRRDRRTVEEKLPGPCDTFKRTWSFLLTDEKYGKTAGNDELHHVRERTMMWSNRRCPAASVPEKDDMPGRIDKLNIGDFPVGLMKTTAFFGNTNEHVEKVVEKKSFRNENLYLANMRSVRNGGITELYNEGSEFCIRRRNVYASKRSFNESFGLRAGHGMEESHKFGRFRGTELKSHDPEYVNLRRERASVPDTDGISIGCHRGTNVLDVPERIQVRSPSQSELLFSNFMDFRNMSEQLNLQVAGTSHGRVCGGDEHSVAGTWSSHYHNSMQVSYDDCIGYGDGLDRTDIFRSHGNPAWNTQTDEHTFDPNPGLELCVSPGKRDAAVQTDACEAPYVPEPRKVTNDESTSNEVQAEVGDGLLPSSEVPYPDFWNESVGHDVAKDSSEQLPDDVVSTGNLMCHSQRTNAADKSSGNVDTTKGLSSHAIWADYPTNLDKASNKSPSLMTSTLVSNEEHLPATVPIQNLQEASADAESIFHLTERHNFMPKGLSPACQTLERTHLMELSPGKKQEMTFVLDNSENDLLAFVKWQDDSTGGSTKPAIPDGILDEMRQKAEKGLIYCENEMLSASLSYSAIKVHNLLHSFAFTRELLSNAEVIGQLDKKFIVAKMIVAVPKRRELITLFDQHAVDERIKLEELMNDYVSTDGKLISSSLLVHIQCRLNNSTVQVISNMKDQLNQIGFRFKVVDEETISLEAAPKFLVRKYSTAKENSEKIGATIEVLIGNLAEELMETRGAVLNVPKVLHNLFCSEACRSAIKFNKALTVIDMREMIDKLRNCKLPFQCAHGRPSVIPAIDLEDFENMANEKNEFDFNELDKFKSGSKSKSKSE